MINAIKRYTNKFGNRGILALIFAPITVVITTPFFLVMSLLNCRVLANGQWSHYSRFNPTRGLNSLFYWNQALNIEKFSFQGTSTLIGNGRFELSRWFHLSLPSIILNWRLGPVAILIGMFGWLFLHTFWLTGPVTEYFWLIIACALCSSSFYCNLFELQNYNVMGWLFFPLGIWCLYNQQYELAAICWLLCSFGSITACFIAAFLCLASALQVSSIMPIFSMIPAVLKIALHFLRMLEKGHLLEQVIRVAKGIGVVKGKKKLIRKAESSDYIKTIYYSILLAQFQFFYMFSTGYVDYLLVSLWMLMIVNDLKIMRFADLGSILMPIMTVCTAMLIMSFDWQLFLSWLLLMNPIPYFLSFTDRQKYLFTVPLRAPFDLRSIKKALVNLLEKIPPGEKVICCFDDPVGNYQRVFDGQRAIHEAVLYFASERNIHVFPDWYLVFENNITDSEADFWGRSIEEIEKNLASCKGSYFLYYESEENPLDTKGRDVHLVGWIDWESVQSEIGIELPIATKGTKWSLYQLTSDESL